MKRSEINRCIAQAISFFDTHQFVLPPFSNWSEAEWRKKGREADEIRSQHLGWDVTDFNSGQFDSLGLTLFTLRNGSPSGNNSKCYAEKIMYVRQDQVTPWHYHARKAEDIINRGGGGAGRLVVKLCGSTSEGGFSTDRITVTCDGVARELDPESTVVLGPGESITLPPFLYHTFHAEGGDALIGEVSSFNDDDRDNFFHDPLPRYPEIVEDEPRFRLLCNEYRML